MHTKRPKGVPRNKHDNSEHDDNDHGNDDKHGPSQRQKRFRRRRSTQFTTKTIEKTTTTTKTTKKSRPRETLRNGKLYRFRRLRNGKLYRFSPTRNSIVFEERERSSAELRVRHRQQLVDAFEGGHLPCVNGGFAVEVSSEDLAAELRAQVGQPVAAEDVLPRGRLSPGKDDVGRGLLGTGHAKKCMVNTVWLCGGELRAGGGYTLVTASCGLIDGMVALVALVACNNNKRCKRK